MNVMMGNRERLLLAAREIFLEQGYEASVDAIIGRAEVARQTFYNHFKTKESLFAQVVRDCFLDILAPLNEHPDDLRACLKNFAGVYRKRVLNSEGVAAYRMLISQMQKFPDLIHEVYMLGTGQMIERLADYLHRAMEQKKLRRIDPVFAAELLMAMVVGQERTQCLFGIPPGNTDEELKIEIIIDGFLRMFAPELDVD